VTTSRTNPGSKEIGEPSSSRISFWTTTTCTGLAEVASLRSHHQQAHGEEGSKRISEDGHGNVDENQIANSEHDQRQDHERPEAGARAVSFPEEEQRLERGRACCREIGATLRNYGKNIQVENQ